MASIAIITARGGSKRIPGKNIRDFVGKPIIAYSIKAARESGIFDEVMVSTDSEEIAAAAKKYGAAVPFLRSEKTSNDWATTADVLLEVIENYRIRNRQFERICCIYPTAPFLTGERLREANKVLEDAKAESLMPVVRFSFPPQRGMVIREGRVDYRYPEFRNTRSQDLEVMYHDCGQFYFCRTDAFLKHRTMVTPDTVPFEMSEEEVQDIDNLSDWQVAELKYKMLVQKREGCHVPSV
ncbi:MAG: pseudaminic acid cytidylyltransferase [Lachnospiraceae bacterium]|nr:pseudaminic acid cytidylyltransferase [Lachnospiraceae bacterium]